MNEKNILNKVTNATRLGFRGTHFREKQFRPAQMTCFPPTEVGASAL